METYGVGMAAILGLVAYIGIVTTLAPGLWWGEALVAGWVTGLLVGDPTMGLTVGATLTLMSLGMWTYGGSTIPDFMTGAIIGTAFGALTGDTSAGLAVAIPASLLMTQLDVFGRAITTVFIHGADKYIEEGNVRGITWMHILGQLPWGLTRAVPVFLAVWLGAGPVQDFINWMPAWFSDGISVTGKILPALGFALLLSQLPVKKYWPFLLLGFVLFAYLSVPTLGIAFVGIALAALWLGLKGGSEHAEPEA